MVRRASIAGLVADGRTEAGVLLASCMCSSTYSANAANDMLVAVLFYRRGLRGGAKMKR